MSQANENQYVPAESDDIFSTIRIANLHEVMKAEITRKNFKGYSIHVDISNNNEYKNCAFSVGLCHRHQGLSYYFKIDSLRSNPYKKINATWRFGDTVFEAHMRESETCIPTTEKFDVVVRIIKFLRELFPALELRRLLVDTMEIKDPQLLCEAISNMSCSQLSFIQREKIDSSLVDKIFNCLDKTSSKLEYETCRNAVGRTGKTELKWLPAGDLLDKINTYEVDQISFTRMIVSTEDVLKLFTSWKEGATLFNSLVFDDIFPRIDSEKLAKLIGEDETSLQIKKDINSFECLIERQNGTTGKFCLSRNASRVEFHKWDKK